MLFETLRSMKKVRIVKKKSLDFLSSNFFSEAHLNNLKNFNLLTISKI